ncbi:MAG TPA: 23S rRNA (guanosine(2251)-2'-O)-methyltransferase RlmB [Kofleriaceae bacterium]|jgi:23S rRNA (guanosine2251-2'-O)-methyltransferase|nr:23S rRNA (guanosine(2251)-2'-O)-methyltransferase RlmB [Kofleriaceae bacterium]
MSRRVFGVGPVRELLRARPKAIRVLHVAAERADARGKDPVAELTAAARAAGVAVDLRSMRELDALCEPGARHQGVVAATGDFRYADVDDLVAAAGDAPPLLVVLDGVQDPHNLGAIVRSAYVLGAHGVIIPEHRAAAVTPTVTKASAGATELLPIAVAKNLVRALEQLKEAGVWTCAVAAVPGARPIGALDLKGPLALVLGAEGEGVRPLVARTCDLHALIPMAGEGVGSLNVSVAAGIALYEATRQRGAGR